MGGGGGEEGGAHVCLSVCVCAFYFLLCTYCHPVYAVLTIALNIMLYSSFKTGAIFILIL